MKTIQSPVMQMLQEHMKFMTQRQEVLAENVANIDTPYYQARDLKKPDFEKMVQDAASGSQLKMYATSGKHLSGNLGVGAYRAFADDHTGEASPTGNNVTVEDEMAKISETGVQYQMSSSLFRKFTGLYRAALGK